MNKLFRITALLEGVSYILLLFIAVPIKYLFNDPSYVKLLGMPHGILFIAYIFFSIAGKFKYKWGYKDYFIISLESSFALINAPSTLLFINQSPQTAIFSL